MSIQNQASVVNSIILQNYHQVIIMRVHNHYQKPESYRENRESYHQIMVGVNQITIMSLQLMNMINQMRGLNQTTSLKLMNMINQNQVAVMMIQMLMMMMKMNGYNVEYTEMMNRI